MKHHDRPAQVARHCEQPDRRLDERAEKNHERELNDPARKRGRTPCGKPHDERHCDGGAAEQAVAELDVCVSVLRWQWMPLLAARPVAAAETGVGEPHGGAGTYDQPESADLDERE